MKSFFLFLTFISYLVISDCQFSIASPLPNHAYQGGTGTVFQTGSRAFSLPMKGLDRMSRRHFQVGDQFFTDNWVIAPASTTDRDGLGPLFNARSCSSCHLKDGRGSTPSGPEEEPLGLLVRITEKEPGQNSVYGGQIQNRALPGLAPEASIAISWKYSTFRYPNGKTVKLRKPIVSLKNLAYGPTNKLALSLRLAPQLIGLGLLESISEKHIIANSDPEDKNKDGIRGIVRYLKHPVNDKPWIGRFGWKAEQASLKLQNATALQQDMGLTSSLLPKEPCTESQKICAKRPNGGHPEVSDHILDRITHYTRLIAVPAQRQAHDPDVKKGREIFQQIACSSCHTPKQIASSEAKHPYLENQEFYPYTNMLLHDMGADLADHNDNSPMSRLWRTPPLWGIGLFKAVNGNQFYLHDGRAETIEEAILWHGGEAQASKKRFTTLSEKERSQLLSFLSSL